MFFGPADIDHTLSAGVSGGTVVSEQYQLNVRSWGFRVPKTAADREKKKSLGRYHARKIIHANPRMKKPKIGDVETNPRLSL